MRAKIITMASAKGGAGKTVLTATFSAFLVSLGKKVLMIDSDASTNGLTLMYLQEVRIQNDYALSGKRTAGGTFQLGDEKYAPEIVLLKNGVELLPATYPYINTESTNAKEFKNGILSYLNAIVEKYDYIFLDAQAGSDHFAEIAISREISDEVIIVSEYDPLSAAGVERLKGFYREDLTYDRTWILLNKMLPDFVQSFSDFLEVSKYLSPIPWDADVVRAYAKRKLAIDPINGNEFTLAIIQTLKGVLGDAIIPDIDNWISEKSKMLQLPIITQYKETESQLEQLLSKEMKNVKMRNVIRNRYLFLTFLIVIIFTYFIFNYFFKNEKDSYILTIFTFVLMGTTFLLGMNRDDSLSYLNKKTKESIEDIDKYKLRREISYLEEKLKKLQVLRDMDTETLIKSKQRNTL